MGRLPDFIIIGAMKAGTTSLYYYLNAHPEVSMSTVKEINFFSRPQNFERGVDWYTSHFIETPDAKVYGEASTSYTKYPRFTAAEQLHTVIPDARLIYILRDPIERIVSHYTHTYTQREEKRPFDVVMAQLDTNHYVRCSQYFMQLQQYLPRYPLERILILTAESLRHQRAETMRKTLHFLGVEETFDPAAFDMIHHQTAEKTRQTNWGSWSSQHLKFNRWLAPLLPAGVRSKLAAAYRRFTVETIATPVLTDELRERLRAHLQDDVDSLRALTGCPFDEWSL